MAEWKPLERYDGLYLISDEGEIFSTRSKRMLTPIVQSNGYVRIELNVNGENQKEYVHRLVAECFIPNPNNYPIVNHKDENPRNNRADNLEWCSYQYNSNYGKCQKKIQENRTYSSGAENAKSKRVYQYDLEGNFIAEYGSTGEAARVTGLAAPNIARAAAGTRRQYAGYVWSYKKEFKGYTSEIVEKFKKGAILMYDLQGNLIRRFENSKELKDADLSQISVNRVCRGERKSYKGYTFKHEGE